MAAWGGAGAGHATGRGVVLATEGGLDGDVEQEIARPVRVRDTLGASVFFGDATVVLAAQSVAELATGDVPTAKT